MKASHRALMILGPLGMLLMSLLLYQRADARFEQLTVEVFEARSLLEEAADEDRVKLQRDFDKVLYERHTKETGRGFWGFAVGVSGFFLALSLLFTLFEVRHARRRDRLMQSLGDQ